MVHLFQLDQRLHGNPASVVVRPFHLAWQASGPDLERVQKLARDILELDTHTVRAELAVVLSEFADRHWQIERVFDDRFAEIMPKLGLDGQTLPRNTRRLIGAYFCHEYSYAAAALMNPSVVRHPDQSGLQADSVRILLSLRAVGEGHISTIAFREGIISAGRQLKLFPEPSLATSALMRPPKADTPEGSIALYRHRESSISGTVIFPMTEAQRNGLEDLRLVEFTRDSGKSEWIGTYTAYSGRSIRSELLRTRDFRDFSLTPIQGGAGRNKGMALFPRKISGQFAMVGRQDGKNLYLMQSAKIDEWDGGTLILEPRFPWELVQIGNCGSPIELDEGWLLLTHGVGAMRKYSIGAALLDKNDPSKVLGRTPHPILAAADEDREGYVPNVVYTCGAIRVADDLFLPYGVADSSVCFAFVSIREILDAMV
ncbi:glycosidase [Sphingorhabdus pulchriflava]|uniref:Glycosidase n=1 Tax=Sphingorhabdus pulchriflava TaxID=2292257 RepID=A0A371BEU0_9SPHN|nr:glycoside hydrolase family 130 protein [Sphingorhabdus pulchriflava]RDV06119.1 glycosidase [Sphingorhabdus pulchriflava]